MWRLCCALLLVGCNCVPPPPPPDGGSCELELQWGREPGCLFTAYATGQNAEMTLGFQGFRFVESAARLTGTTAPSAKFTFELAIEGQSPSAQPAGTIELRAGDDGALYAHELLLFLNDVPLAELVGRRADITLGATIGPCHATHAVTVTLVDEDPSIQGADAGLLCPGP